MTIRGTTALCIALAGVVSAASAQEAPGSLEQLKMLRMFKQVPKVEALHAGALKGRDQYRGLVTEENFAKLGLRSAEEASAAELGTPIRDYLVRLDRLARYKPGDDAEALLTDTQIVHYPLVVQNDARAMVSMTLVQGAWKLMSVGEAQRTTRLFGTIRKSAQKSAQGEGDHFSVRVPALNLEFAGARDAQKTLLLTPLEDDALWELKRDVAESAAKVFARLAPAARAHDGLPR